MGKRKTQEPVAWLRDLDGTGSLHACAKGDPGAIAVYRKPRANRISAAERRVVEAVVGYINCLSHPKPRTLSDLTKVVREYERAKGGANGKS